MIERISMGELTLNAIWRAVEWGDRRINLTPQEFTVLRLLLLSGKASHSEIYTALYNLPPYCPLAAYELVGPLMTRLRKKIPPGFVATARGERKYFIDPGALHD